MVLVQNKYKNTLVGVLRTHITFVTHSSPLCYVTLRTQVMRLNSGYLSPQETDSYIYRMCVRVKYTVSSFSKDFMELFFSQLVLSQYMFSFLSLT